MIVGGMEEQMQSLISARTRRQRGYTWEDVIVKRLNSCDGWRAFRLGSPSIGLPDVLATSTKLDTILAIEAKSGSTNMIHVPADQIERCMNWLDAFGRYSNRHALLACKFISKKWKSQGVYEKRERREYFKLWNPRRKACDLVFRYDGSIYTRRDGERKRLHLENFVMPFQNS
ncbi:MAG: resolvase [Nitrososphaerales archaeon]